MKQNGEKGLLFIVATPIGNLDDITLRAVGILRNAEVIACEDTRTAKKLLAHFNIKIPLLISCEEHNEQERIHELLEYLISGRNIVLITESGTPLVSDPGYRLVSEAVKNEITVIPIPGPSAVTAALSASGCTTDKFSFFGFLPRKEEKRRALLKKLLKSELTAVFFESPHRLKRTLEEIDIILGRRKIVICREITKIYEEFLRGTAADILKTLRTRKDIKGEITIIIEKADDSPPDNSISITLDSLCDILENEASLSPSKAAHLAAKLSGLPRREIYSRILKKK